MEVNRKEILTHVSELLTKGFKEREEIIRCFHQYGRELNLEIIPYTKKLELYIFYRITEPEPRELLRELISRWKDDQKLIMYYEKAEDVLQFKTSYEDLEWVMSCQGQGMGPLISHVEEMYKARAPLAPIPSYVNDYGVELENVRKLKWSKVDCSREMLLISLMARNDIILANEEEELNGEDKEKVLKQILREMSEEEVKQLATSLIPNEAMIMEIRKDLDVFRAYGPLNTRQYNDYSNLKDSEGFPDKNKIYGGERMFTEKNWFTGNCMVCLKRIRSYHHAVRRPYLKGDWYGCFCSFACVRETIDDEILLGVLDLIESDVNEYGIQEREYEELEEPTTHDYSVLMGLME